MCAPPRCPHLAENARRHSHAHARAHAPLSCAPCTITHGSSSGLVMMPWDLLVVCMCILTHAHACFADAVLYFYEGQTCLLRCWQRSSQAEHTDICSSSGSSSPTEDSMRTKDHSSGEDQARANGSSDAPPRAAARKTRLKTAKTKGDKAKSKGRTHGKERNASARPSARASHATGSNAAGTDNGLTKGVEARVAAWAVGKDLPSMLGSLGSFSRDFASALPQTAASELRQKPPQVLRRAYHKACLALHPDRHVGSSPESQALALALFQTLSSAFISSANHDDNLSA